MSASEGEERTPQFHVAKSAFLTHFGNRGEYAVSSLLALSSSSERATRYSCPGGVAAVLTPPVGPIASAVLVEFAGSGFVSVSTALLAKRCCTGLGVSSTTAALGLPS